MANVPNTTPGQVAYSMYQRRLHHLTEPIPLDYPRPFSTLSAAHKAAWEAAAEAVLRWQQARSLLYVVVMQEGTQLQLCGAYTTAEEAEGHLAHARTIMPDRQMQVRICPCALTGQAHRQEDAPHA